MVPVDPGAAGFAPALAVHSATPPTHAPVFPVGAVEEIVLNASEMEPVLGFVNDV
jgi:hypothetical protein